MITVSKDKHKRDNTRRYEYFDWKISPAQAIKRMRANYASFQNQNQIIKSRVESSRIKSSRVEILAEMSFVRI